MTLKSDIDQIVYLTAHTWNEREIPAKCLVKDNTLRHAIFVAGMEDNYTWRQGDYAVPAMTLIAGA